ncbi:MAG: hypothetical protein IJ608_02915 [Lachnospiraceae bacterium]|nr:hypothetical protein [Lachnospiraceae bacterium]
MTLVLSDGTRIEGITMNGNNYVSQEEVKESDLAGKLSHVSVEENGAVTQELENAALVQILHYNDGWYIALREMTETEVMLAKLRADTDYIAAMSDVDLEG